MAINVPALNDSKRPGYVAAGIDKFIKYAVPQIAANHRDIRKDIEAYDLANNKFGLNDYKELVNEIGDNGFSFSDPQTAKLMFVIDSLRAFCSTVEYTAHMCDHIGAMIQKAKGDDDSVVRKLSTFCQLPGFVSSRLLTRPKNLTPQTLAGWMASASDQGDVKSVLANMEMHSYPIPHLVAGMRCGLWRVRDIQNAPDFPKSRRLWCNTLLAEQYAGDPDTREGARLRLSLGGNAGVSRGIGCNLRNVFWTDNIEFADQFLESLKTAVRSSRPPAFANQVGGGPFFSAVAVPSNDGGIEVVRARSMSEVHSEMRAAPIELGDFAGQRLTPYANGACPMLIPLFAEAFSKSGLEGILMNRYQGLMQQFAQVWSDSPVGGNASLASYGDRVMRCGPGQMPVFVDTATGQQINPGSRLYKNLASGNLALGPGVVQYGCVPVDQISGDMAYGPAFPGHFESRTYAANFRKSRSAFGETSNKQRKKNKKAVKKAAASKAAAKSHHAPPSLASIALNYDDDTETDNDTIVAQSPKKGAKSPKKGTKSPKKGTKSPKKGAKSPKKGTKSPKKAAKSPKKGAKSPKKGAKSPSRVWTQAQREAARYRALSQPRVNGRFSRYGTPVVMAKVVEPVMGQVVYEPVYKAKAVKPVTARIASEPVYKAKAVKPVTARIASEPVYKAKVVASKSPKKGTKSPKKGTKSPKKGAKSPKKGTPAHKQQSKTRPRSSIPRAAVSAMSPAVRKALGF